jgi:hypothetical protein
MEIKVIVNTRKEFQELLRSDFIPYLVSNGFAKDIPFYQSQGMFSKWTSYFYPDKSVELIENK